MAPGYRTNAQTRRGARGGFPEHDDFEGLPVRQWRIEQVTIAPPQELEENKKNDRWAVELPHGMPKDSEMLPPHSQALLRAARSGALYKRPPPPDDDDADADGLPGDKPEKKVSAISQGFTVGVWKKVPRNAEGPTVSHLAKRHKGTITLPSKALATQITGPMITKATVRRIDAAGNPYTQEVTISDGQQVDGEIISTSVVPVPEQPAQAVSAAGTPGRRKPPMPQKKKGRGRGRGRGRGKLPLPTSTRSEAQGGAGLDAVSEVKTESIATTGVKIKIEDGKELQDVEMIESSALDEEGDEGEGDGDEDEEGDGDESGTPAEKEDQEMEDAPSLPLPSSSSSADATLASTADVPDIPMALAPPGLNTDASRVEGSPLKNVIIRSPPEASPRISPLAVTSSTEAGLSGVPGEPTLGLQPSPLEQSQPRTASPPVEVVTSDDTQTQESAAPVSTETALKETPDDVAITSTQEPEVPLTALPAHPAVSAVAVEQPPAEEPTQPSAADIPLPTSEKPMPGQVSAEPEPQPQEEAAKESQPQETEKETQQEPEKEPENMLERGGEQEPEKETETEPEKKLEKEQEKEPGEEPEKKPVDEPELGAPAEPEQDAPNRPVPNKPVNVVETAMAGQAPPTEDGTDDGSDLLGPLGASLNQQAEDDAPPSAPAPAAEEP